MVTNFSPPTECTQRGQMLYAVTAEVRLQKPRDMSEATMDRAGCPPMNSQWGLCLKALDELCPVNSLSELGSGSFPSQMGQQTLLCS